ncbi:Copper amine oxidase family protein [Striga hermonthica]|uniref:Amine oxidase n=1 Tax=Striga hermonthica TaxID=68872 RepID=A0A9N7R5D6_STRHE|nr:Copper amine oxidase family protein [Striga hermonthica]
MLNGEEQALASELPHKYPPFVESITKRKLKLSEVLCEAFTIGWYGEKNTKRVVQVMCYYVDGTINFYMRPIEGIMATVDLDLMKIVGYHDRQMIPVAKGDGVEYVESKQGPLYDNRIKGMTILQQDGPSFTLDGNNVRWANWDFHLGFDMRVGPVISLASIFDHDKNKYRSVLYKGYVSELFVPYQDLSEEWWFRTFLDAGEFGFGICAVPLQPSRDCPKNAKYFDGYYTSRDGTPVKIPNVFCIFERYSGDVMWRHTEAALPGDDIAVSLSGILAVKGSKYTHQDQIKEEVYGTLVAENTIAVRHNHFLTFHLDLDIDGPANSLTKTHLKTVRVANGTFPRRSYWTAVHETAKTESDAKMTFNSGDTEVTIVNPNKRTNMGHHVGYRLVPGPVAAPLLLGDDYEQIRGAFSNYHVWATPYNRSEKWAGGDFVDQAHGDDTLAAWTMKNRDIVNKDIVVWHTLGVHHVPVQEDYPIMPTLSGSFELKPTNFFDYNPVLKVKPLSSVDWVNCSAKSS